MSRANQAQTNPDDAAHSPRLRQGSGTLYLIALSQDPEAISNLKTDLGRCQIKDYKLQICASAEETTKLLSVSRFHLLFLDLGDFKGDQTAFDQIRSKNQEMPIIGLAHRRAILENRISRYQGIDDCIAKEDLSPSLVESITIHASERRAILESRKLLQDRLTLSLSAGQQGQWTYYPSEDALELDAISSALFGLEPRPNRITLTEIISHVGESNAPILKEAFQCLDGEDREIRCTLQVPGQTVPQPQIELIGRSAPPHTLGSDVLIGIARPATQANAIVKRILEANTEVQTLLDQRDSDLRAANRRLRAIAAELDLGETETAEPAAQTPKTEPVAKKALPPIPKPKATEAKPKRKKPAVKKVELPEIGMRPDPLAKEIEPEITIDLTQPEPAKAEALDPKSPPKKTKTPKAKASSKAPDDNLKFDSEQAFQDVLKSIKQQQESRPKRAKQESFPFDFSSEPLNDSSPPNPSQEGFVSAANRLVAITREGHDIDMTISVSDKKAVENEREKSLLFEVLRELLTNVVRHSKASLCIISLFRDEDEWVLQVEDDGIGIDDTLKSVSTPLKQIGLFQIRTKLALKGGHLDMTPASPTGLVARARLPFTAQEAVKR